MNKKAKMVYCPKCEEVADANELYCPHCKENLRNAMAVDPGEEIMPYRNKHANDMNHFFWGLIMLGGMFIILLLSWVYNCLPFVAVD